MEIVIIIFLVAAIAWLVMSVRRSVLASEHATLNSAWREVLDDPNYNERRVLEEQKRAAENQERMLDDNARALVEGKAP
jgi:uncharacterized membrane protein